MHQLPPASKYPKKIYIRNECYKIKFTKRIQHFGDTDPVSRVIRIRAGMSKRETFKTMIHELLHALSFEGGKRLKMRHKLVYALEDAITELLLDNFL